MTKQRVARRVRLGELAELLGLSRQQLSVYAQRPGAPREKKGKDWAYLWPDFLRFYVEEARRQAREQSKPASFDDARTRKMAAEAELAELQLAKERGQVLTVADMEREVGGILDQVRARLLALPARIGAAVVGVKTVSEGTARIEPLVHEAMEQLTRDDGREAAA